MEEYIKKFVDPFKRLEEIRNKLNVLEEQEKELKGLIQRGLGIRINKDKLHEVESDIFYLIVEKEAYTNCLNWLEIYKKGFEAGRIILEEQTPGDKK